MERAGQQYADSNIPPGDPEVRRLLACLQSLVDGHSAIEELVACGPAAIPPLREFLLSGRITSVPQPRMWAVEALALLEARDVLIEYLRAPSRGADAQLQFAEDAVKNTAGRRLSAWRDNETFEILLDFCRKRNLPGVIETVAEFERPEAIPSLDRALEDDMCRTAAEDGLRRLGPAARNALVLSAVTPLPNADEETPSSLCRRRSTLRLLTVVAWSGKVGRNCGSFSQSAIPSWWPDSHRSPRPSRINMTVSPRQRVSCPYWATCLGLYRKRRKRLSWHSRRNPSRRLMRSCSAARRNLGLRERRMRS